MRVIRTLRRLGIRSVAVYSDADAGAPHVAAADVASIGPARPRELPVDRGGDRGGAGDRRGGDPPRLRLPRREHRVRRGLRRGRDRVRRPAGVGDRGDGRQDPRQADRRRGRRAGRARARTGPGSPTTSWRRPPRGSATRCCSSRRPAVAARACARCTGADDLADAIAVGPARGARLVRRRHPARRAPGHHSAAHRDPGAGRRARQRGPPRRARVPPAAPAPEDRRGGAVAAAHARRSARRWAPPPCEAARAVRLHRRRHRRVHRRRGRPAGPSASSWR